MISKTLVQKDIIDTAKVSGRKGLVSLVKPSNRGLSPEEIARYRAVIVNGSDSWESLLDTLEDARLASGQAVLVQGETKDPQEKEKQHVLRFSADESVNAKTVREIQSIIDSLPPDIQDHLKTLGAGLAENLVQRYGTAAPSVLRKNCIEREPRDPILHVDIKSGAIIFDHMDEFRDNPWGITNPRAGSLMAAMSGSKGDRMPEPVQETDQERVLASYP